MRTSGWLAVPLLALFLSATANAQQRSTDVGGQPAKRTITKMPRLVTFVPADYPADRKAAGVEASVVLTIEISGTGHVTNVLVSRSAGPDFDAAAAKAAAAFESEPAEVDDKPAPAKITYR